MAKPERLMVAYHECASCGKINGVPTKEVISRTETKFLRGFFWRCPWCPWCPETFHRSVLTIVSREVS